MKIEDVPQDLKYLDGTIVRDLTYAVDADGNYHGVISDGWTAKNDALEMTLDCIDEECEEIRQRVIAGETSPLEYHAAKGLMDIELLSDYTGIAKRKIRKHFNPQTFATLDAATLCLYADALRISVEELKTVPED